MAAFVGVVVVVVVAVDGVDEEAGEAIMCMVVGEEHEERGDEAEFGWVWW